MQSLSSDILLSTADSQLIQNLDVNKLQNLEPKQTENTRSFGEYLSEEQNKIDQNQKEEVSKEEKPVEKNEKTQDEKKTEKSSEDVKDSKKSVKTEKKHNEKNPENEENLKLIKNNEASDKKSSKSSKDDKKSVDFSLYELKEDNKISDIEEKINLDVKDISDIKTEGSEKQQKITVTDLRTKNQSENTEKDSSVKTQVKFTGEKSAEISMDFSEKMTAENMLSETTQNTGAEKPNFQAMVSAQIQNSVPDFVKTGSIILKDNDKATINLVLHPDEIGNIKVNLSMDGKTLSGHIIVASKEALEVFKDNAQTLREAFAKQGFDVSDFNVSYNNNSSSNSGNFENNWYQDTYSAKKAYSSINYADENFETNFSDVKLTDFYINIVA
ncbi:MAG: flagellar hook-length control protein FliK [Treponema sp.]|nr:flagellar hook-length control protein FliK [Treponema sp.]